MPGSRFPRRRRSSAPSKAIMKRVRQVMASQIESKIFALNIPLTAVTAAAPFFVQLTQMLPGSMGGQMVGHKIHIQRVQVKLAIHTLDTTTPLGVRVMLYKRFGAYSTAAPIASWAVASNDDEVIVRKDQLYFLARNSGGPAVRTFNYDYRARAGMGELLLRDGPANTNGQRGDWYMGVWSDTTNAGDLNIVGFTKLWYKDA